jgi:hypothetical protein
MKRGSLVMFACALVLVHGRTAQGGPSDRANTAPVTAPVTVPDTMWSPRVVKWPVDPAQIQSTPGWAPAGVADTSGTITVTGSRAAVVWLGPTEIIRVRAVRGDAADLRFRRVTGSAGARLWIDEPGARVDRGIQLIEPPGPGALWTITTPRAISIIVETVRARSPRLAWEQTRAEVVRWIAQAGTVPTIPGDEDQAIRLRLLGAQAFVRALGAVTPPVSRALGVWRLVDAELAIASRRRANDPYIDRALLTPPGAATVDDEGVAFGSPAGPWQLTVEGPGTILVEARAERPPGGWVEATATLDVRLDGALAARRQEPTAPFVTPKGSALPVDPETQRFGRRIRAELELGPGRHTLAASIANARLLRLERRTRRPRLRDPDLGAQIRAARAGIAGDPSPVARAAETLLARLVGQPATGATGISTAAELAVPVATYAVLRTAPALLTDAAAAKQLAIVTRLVGDPRLEQTLAEALVFELMTRLPPAYPADALATIIVRWSQVSPAVLAVLAPHLVAGNPSDAVSAAERAWRQAPNAELPQHAMFATIDVAQLRRLEPRRTGPSAEPVASGWVASIAKGSPVAGAGELIDLDLGARWAVDIPPAPGGGQLAVIKVFATTRPDTPGPIRIWLDERLHTTIGIAAVERIELAAQPGPHTLRVEGPAGSHAFVSVPGAQGARQGMIRGFHVADAGDTTPRYLLPAARSSAPIRIELRTRFTGQVAPRTIEAVLHSDAGSSRRLVLEVTGVERDTWPLTGDAQLSAAASAWVWMPPLTERVWITTSAPDLLVHMATRQGAGETAVTTSSEPPLVDPLAEVAAQSVILVASPDDAAAYLARARALIQLDEIASARRDLAAASATAVGPQLRTLALRVAELDARYDRDYLPAQPPGGPITDGVALGPLLPPDADPARALELARKHRTATKRGPPGAAPADDDVGVRWLGARLAELAGRSEEAAALWRGIGSWQANAAALVAMTSSTFDESDRDATIAFGLADELAAVELPRLRRARILAFRRSRWSPITNTIANAGTERMALATTPLAATPRSTIRRALLAVPWPDGKLVEPGNETTFTVQGPAKVAIEAWCRRLWANPTDGRCQPSVRVDQHAPIVSPVPYGQSKRLVELSIDPGRHQITVALDKADPLMVSAIRLVELGGPAVVARSSQLFLASDTRPAEIVVAGPMTVGIEIRGFGRTEPDARLARRAIVTLQGARPLKTTLAVDRRLVPPAPDDAIVTEPVTHVVAVPAGIHHITVAADRGLLALRFARRIPAGVDSHDPVPPIPYTAAPETGLPWPAELGVPLRIAAEPSSVRFVPSVELVVGKDSFEGLEEGVPVGMRKELSVQLRTRLARTALRGELTGRQVGSLPPTNRLRLTGDRPGLPGGLDAHLELGGGAQQTSRDIAWRLDARMWLQRPWRLSRLAVIAPELGLAASALGPAHPARDTDPWVAGIYRRDHPLQWLARTGLRMRPFADQLATARLEARSNADIIGFDMVGATLAWEGLIEVSPTRGPIARLAYQPSYRFADAGRPEGYLRNDLSAQLGWGFRLPRGRLALAVWGELYLPTAVAGWGRSFGLSVRWSDVRRGEAVHHSFEDAFGDFADQVSWQNGR